MKKILKQLSLAFSLAPSTLLLLCSWESPGMYNYPNRVLASNYIHNDTIPQDKQDEFDKAMKELNEGMKNLNEQMKNLNVNIEKQVKAALSAVDMEAISKQTQETMKAIDWSKMQQEINNSVQLSRDEIAKIDFKKIQDQMQTMQEKFKSEEFKSQFDHEKMQKQMDEARKSIEKAKQKLQEMKAFTDELEADGLIDKKKGYTIEWKAGELYINNNKQPKDISDKYRRYENSGKIKILPEGAEHF